MDAARGRAPCVASFRSCCAPFWGQAAGGNKAEAARLLGIGRRTLYDKLATKPESPS